MLGWLLPYAFILPVYGKGGEDQRLVLLTTGSVGRFGGNLHQKIYIYGYYVCTV